MTPFTEEEQWNGDLDWFACDAEDRIGHFTSVGWRLLPPSVAKSKETLRKLLDYFRSLPLTPDFEICPDLHNHLAKKFVIDFDGYIKPSAEMSLRGLYAYDSYDYSHDERPYFRVTIPKVELRLKDLPEDIREILETLRMNEISFVQNSVISEEITKNL